MSDPRTILLVIQLTVGTMIIRASIPLIRRRVPPNSWYGFRVRRTLEHPEIWYLANRFAALQLLLLGVLMLLTALILFPVPRIHFVVYALSCLTMTLKRVFEHRSRGRAGCFRHPA